MFLIDTSTWIAVLRGQSADRFNASAIFIGWTRLNPSFPRTRESIFISGADGDWWEVIPAHAGIHRLMVGRFSKLERHSRARGNPSKRSGTTKPIPSTPPPITLRR